MNKLQSIIPILILLISGCGETPSVMNVKIGDTRKSALEALVRNGYEMQVGVSPEAKEIATYNSEGILWGEDWKYITLYFGPDDKVCRISLMKYGKITNRQHLDLTLLYLEDWYGKPQYLPDNAIRFGKSRDHFAFFVMNNNAILELY